MDRNTLQKVLIGLFLIACLFLGVRVFKVVEQSKTEGTGNISSSRMTYGRFLEYLEM